MTKHVEFRDIPDLPLEGLTEFLSDSLQADPLSELFCSGNSHTQTSPCADFFNSMPALGSLPSFGFLAFSDSQVGQVANKTQLGQVTNATQLMTSHQDDGNSSSNSGHAVAMAVPEPAGVVKGSSRQQKAPSAAALAQRRYNSKVKAKRQESDKQLEELTCAMDKLLREKEELQKRNEILQSTLNAWETHQEQLFAREEIREIMQRTFVDYTAAMMTKVRRQLVTSKEVEGWTLKDWAEKYFPEYIQRLSELFYSIEVETQRPYLWEGCQELQDLVAMQVTAPPYELYAANETNKASTDCLTDLVVTLSTKEKCRGLFSCWYWALLSWNLDHKLPLPPVPDWRQILAELHLSSSQVAGIHQARKGLLATLEMVAEQRRVIVSQLGLELLAAGRDHIAMLPSTAALRQSWEAERSAVYAFVVTSVDEGLLPLQQAMLDVRSWPWCPDIWQIFSLLDGGGCGTQLPQLAVHAPAIEVLLPRFTAFELLRLPVTAMGGAFQMKRGLLMQSFYTCTPAAAYLLPTQQHLKDLSILDVHCSRWKRWAYYDWKIECIRQGRIVLNDLLDPAGVEAPANGTKYRFCTNQAWP